MIAKIKKRPSMAALFIFCALIPDRDGQEASIHGRTFQYPKTKMGLRPIP
jgi:hypothetical protein